MKVIILAGGKGTRFGELTKKIPKPMIKIHGRPMLIHIISIYASQNFNKFYIATGHRSKIIVDYFKQFQTYKNFYKISGIQKELEINFINTGVNSMTGGRLKRLQKYFKKNENFMLTYGDGLSNVNLKKLKIFHYKKKKIATVTAVRPLSKYGILNISGDLALSFKEKQQLEVGRINGGFFIFNYKIFNFLKNDMTVLERAPLETIAKKKQLCAYKHDGFWQCVDTKRDKENLEKLIKRRLPWRLK